MKRIGIYISGAVALAISLFSIFAFVKTEDSSFSRHTEVVLRQIGHRILLHAGDSTSVILPVIKTEEHGYLVNFSTPFYFKPDSVMKIVKESIADGRIADGYILEMKNAETQQTVFAFEVNPGDHDYSACSGRTMRKGNYQLAIVFLPQTKTPLLWIVPLLLSLAIAGYFIHQKSAKKPASIPSTTDEQIQIGSLYFIPIRQHLLHQNTQIPLHENEARALTIFASQLHQTVTRDQLMKEIWEDKGLIVIDRNVDVLVSKLRKKLQADPTVKILNVHGQGYKMVIEA